MHASRCTGPAPGTAADPLGIGSAGLIGWRYPGILFKQRLTNGTGGIQVDVQGGAFRGVGDPDDADVRATDTVAFRTTTWPSPPSAFSRGGRAGGTSVANHLGCRADAKAATT